MQQQHCLQVPKLRPASLHAAQPRRCCPSHTSSRTRRRICAAPGEDSAAEPQVFGDWREFRAKLILGDRAQQPHVSQENMALLEIQNPKLAQEGVWAHATSRVEQGGLLLATPDNPLLRGDDDCWQAVVLVIQHSQTGTVGLLLNRPTSMLLRPGRGGVRFAIVGAPEGMQEVFADNRVYCGGRVRQDVFHVLHGHKLEGAAEVVAGVYVGGQAAAVQAVREGQLPAGDFKFFAGALVWTGNELQRELDKGAWWTAAASRPLLLKQCLQLPKPLWKEVLECMGGEYAAAAREDIIE